MLHSYEVRWFSVKALGALEIWFNQKGLNFKNDIPARHDFYLPIRSEKRLGIKLREGNVEIKQQIQQTTKRIILPELAEGRLQQWLKWSFDLSDSDNLSHLIVREGKAAWIEVIKNRLAFKYQLDGKSKVLGIVGETDSINEGCQVEYTRLNVHSKHFYTFGVESFSDTQRERENFNASIKMLLNEWLSLNELIQSASARLNLPLKQSMSYPEFLNHIQNGEN